MQPRLKFFGAGTSTTMLKLSILSIIIAIVAVGCSPTATIQPTDPPNARTPEANELIQAEVTNTPQNTTALPPQAHKISSPTQVVDKTVGHSAPISLNRPDASDEYHVLTLVPASWLDKGVWVSNRSKVIQSTGAPDPRTLEEYLDMDERAQTDFVEAYTKLVPPDFVMALRQSPDEWKKELGLNFFSISSTASTGTISSFPMSPVIMMGEFGHADITQKLLDSGREPRTYKGKEYYATRGDLRAELGESLLGSSRTNRIFVDKELFVASQETASMEEFLDVMAGEAQPLTENLLAMAAIESMGETFTAAVLTRTGVFNPVGQIPLTHAKPPDWGNLSSWNILAAGSGIKDGQPFFAFTIAFDDPAAADSNFDEFKARVENYETLIPQRFPDSPHLIEGWPNQPLDEACSDVFITAQRWTFGSTITVFCQTPTSRLWSQLLDLRDLGFLVP